MIFTRILGFVTPIILLMFEVIAEILTKEQEKGKKKKKGKKKEKRKEKEYGYISIGLIVVCWTYSLVNICTDAPIFSVLLWLQKHWWVAGIYILFAAALPSVIAREERSKGTFRAQKYYASRNCQYNLKGVVASCAAFGLIYSVVEDFSYLKFFYIEDLVPVIASVSVWMSIIYQKIEHRKDMAGEVDHDTSLKHMNQKLNLLHLFNVYFLAIVSVVYFVSYIIYCRTYHINIVMRPAFYYILISLTLWFFYAISKHEHRYLYLFSIILIPVILISSVYLTTWFMSNQETRLVQWLFVFAHSMFYMFCVFRREKVIYVKRYNGKKHCKGIRIGKWELLSKNYFLLVLPVVVAIMYIIVWTLPSFVSRLPANEAYNYIDMICADTDVDADKVIERVKEQDIYSAADETYDIETFMQFLSEELGEQLLEKGIIEEEDDVPTRDTLMYWRLNAPRYKVE